MSNGVHETDTPSGAYRRPLFNPDFPADVTDENVTFNDFPLDSIGMGDDESSLDNIDPTETRPVFSGIVALGVAAGGGALAVLMMFALLVAGMYALNLQADDGPQITASEAGAVDVIRD